MVDRCVVIIFAIFRNGNGRITMKGKGNLQILDLKPATEDDPGDGGSYVCRAENDIDSTDAEAELTVLGKYIESVKTVFWMQNLVVKMIFVCNAAQIKQVCCSLRLAPHVILIWQSCKIPGVKSTVGTLHSG